MLAYGVPKDLVDEYVSMRQSTCLESLYMFMIRVFGLEYLREPNVEYTTQLLLINASRGFPVCLGA